MSIRNKIDNRLKESSDWILYDPKSLVILMLMGTGIATLFFGVFSVAFGFRRGWVLTVLFGVFCLLSLKQFIKIYGMVKRLGIKNALGGISAREFIWSRDKDGNKTYGGKENECSGTKQTDEVYNEQNVGSDEIGKEGDGTDNSESERTNAWSRIMLERSRSDVDKNGVSKR